MAIDNLAAERGPDALPPHNADAEEAVLGSILIDSQAVAQVANFLRPGDFFRPQLGTIYDAVLHLYDRREPVDFLTPQDQLQRTGRYDEAGGLAFLSSLLSVVRAVSGAERGSAVRRKGGNLQPRDVAAAACPAAAVQRVGRRFQPLAPGEPGPRRARKAGRGPRHAQHGADLPRRHAEHRPRG